MKLALHGLLQKARLDAAKYQIKPATPFGYAVWKRSDPAWIKIAQFPDRQAAEDYVCGRLALLTE